MHSQKAKSKETDSISSHVPKMPVFLPPHSTPALEGKGEGRLVCASQLMDGLLMEGQLIRWNLNYEANAQFQIAHTRTDLCFSRVAADPPWTRTNGYENCIFSSSGKTT